MLIAETIKSFPQGSWYFPTALKKAYIRFIVLLAGAVEGGWVHPRPDLPVPALTDGA